jgi:hypothetical protein
MKLIRRLALAAALLLGLPAATWAVTVRDIIALTHAGLSDELLIAVIDADRTMFTLSPEQLLELKQAGVSDAVLRKMLGSRREFEPAPAPAPTSAEDFSQYVVITGLDRAPAPRVVAVPYYVPFFVSPVVLPPAPPTAGLPVIERGGFGRFMNDGTRRFLNDGWVGPPFQGTTPGPRSRDAR